MSQIQRFEDLIAWQNARTLTKAIYQVTQESNFKKDYGLVNPIQRASVSIMSNIAEGYERGSEGDFHRFLSIAKASCAEVRSHLYVAYDVGYLSKESFDQLLEQAAEVGRIIGGLRMSVQKQRDMPKR